MYYETSWWACAYHRTMCVWFCLRKCKICCELIIKNPLQSYTKTRDHYGPRGEYYHVIPRWFFISGKFLFVFAVYEHDYINIRPFQPSVWWTLYRFHQKRMKSWEHESLPGSPWVILPTAWWYTYVRESKAIFSAKFYFAVLWGGAILHKLSHAYTQMVTVNKQDAFMVFCIYNVPNWRRFVRKLRKQIASIFY